ncbi:MAG: H-type lectin domain [Sphingomonadales bacterium]|jgi:hypothetical protein|nr:H-type lectin domain [Sphingomonadales bacterium]
MSKKIAPALAALLSLAPVAAPASAAAIRHAVQTATESTPVNHAEGGSFSMASSASSTCPNDRPQVFPIRFQRPFSDTRYVVTVGLSTGDVDHVSNFRLQALIMDRTRDGMTIVARTWCNTTVYSGTFSYSAVGR